VAIFGVGAYYDNKKDVTEEFLEQGCFALLFCACQWNERSAFIALRWDSEKCLPY
jgi:hypothetical protein